MITSIWGPSPPLLLRATATLLLAALVSDFARAQPVEITVTDQLATAVDSTQPQDESLLAPIVQVVPCETPPPAAAQPLVRARPSPTKRLAGAVPKRVVAVVCPPGLEAALQTWIHYRQSQGYTIRTVDGQLGATEIQAAIRQLARQHPLHAVVLVGDGDLAMESDRRLRSVCVPTFLARAEVNEQLGFEPHLATDTPYGDFDGDRMADVPIGRISVDSPQQLKRIIEKVIRYESLPPHGNWRRTVHLAAGVGDFGPIADTVIETAAKKMIADGIPAAYRTTMTYGNWRSPYCPDPRLFREHMLSQVEQGSLFWVYMGHGQARRLDRFHVGNLLIPVLEMSDVPKFRSAAGVPVAVLLACYTGAYDQPKDCLAEMLLRSPDGPIAVLAASRVSMPYSMSLFGNALMDEVFRERSAAESPTLTLGEVVMRGKRQLVADGGGQNRRWIDSLARTLSPTKSKLEQERLEHQLLFNLLGDPLLQMTLPQSLPIAAPERVTAGNSIVVRGQATFAGKCLVELVCRRDRLTFTPPKRDLSTGDPALKQMNETYRRANDPRWVNRTVELKPGKFAVGIDVPEKAHGQAHVRVVLHSTGSMAVGSSDLYIQRPEADHGLRTSNAER